MSRATAPTSGAARWADVPRRLRARGLRWTPQRRVLLDVLARMDGHVTGAEIVDGCRAIDPATTPSTVYRTLDVLEGLGYLSHHHGMDGREEFHVLPTADHGHLHCRACGASWEISAVEADEIAGMLDAGRTFRVDRSHITISGTCADCAGGVPTP